MFRRCVHRALPLCFFVFADPCAAIGTTFIPLEGNNSTGFVQLAGDRFHRDTYERVGARAQFDPPYFDSQSNYLVQPGETWTWILRQTSGTPFGGPQELGRAETSFVGGQDRCWSFGFCGALASVTVTFPYRCMPEQDHEIELLHNGQSVGIRAFRPTRYTPDIVRAQLGQFSLHPEVPFEPAYGTIPSFQKNADSTTTAIALRDNLGCDMGIDDATVRLTGKVQPQSSAHPHLHYHFGPDERGTGSFQIIAGYSSVVSPDQPTVGQPGYNRAVIEGKSKTLSSFLRGTYAATLVAGQHGVAEHLLVDAKRVAVGNDPELKAPQKEIEVDFRVPGLVEMSPTTETMMIFADGGGCTHSSQPGQTEDLSLWLTADTRFHFRVVAEQYFFATGNKLSANDGSLPFGGFFENDSSKANPDPRDRRCHLYHRTGRDFDLNGTDSGGKRINCTTAQAAAGCTKDTLTINGRPKYLVKHLTELVEDRGGARVPEDRIHYRFPY